MIRLMKFRSVFLIFVLAAVLVFLGFQVGKLFESYSTILSADILSQKPVTVSQRVFLSGQCELKLHGWANELGASEAYVEEFGSTPMYLDIDSVDASLESSSVKTTLQAKPSTKPNNLEVKFWSVEVPHGGLLTVTITSYKSSSPNITHANAFLHCENGSLFQAPGLLFIVAGLLFLMGFLLLIVVIGHRLLYRK